MSKKTLTAHNGKRWLQFLHTKGRFDMAAMRVINFGNYSSNCKYRSGRTNDIDNCNVKYGAPPECCESGCPFYPALPPLNFEGVQNQTTNSRYVTALDVLKEFNDYIGTDFSVINFGLYVKQHLNAEKDPHCT
jgi:hypothetical protein